MEHKLTKEDADKIWLLKNFEDAVIHLENMERSGGPLTTAEKSYNTALRKLLAALLGRKPTDYELHLARDNV